MVAMGTEGLVSIKDITFVAPMQRQWTEGITSALRISNIAFKTLKVSRLGVESSDTEWEDNVL